MQKRGQCQCGCTVTIPNSECLYECRNCKEKGFFLCHIIPQPEDPMLVRCKTCKIAYSIFKCPQCQGTGVIKQFKSGQQYGCVCGFNATFIMCNICTVLLCLPPFKNYENIKISCKKCNNQFKYIVCRDCQECNYIKANQNAQSVLKCFNQNCKSQNLFKSSQQNHKGQKQTSKKWNCCRVCQVSEAVMINSECMHLSVCQRCYASNPKMICPICKGVGKQYFKVRIQ